jgi:hypothetical protein
MLIDKSKFLVLVAAISTASAACVIVDDDDSDGFGGDNNGAGNEGAGDPGTTKSSSSTGNDGGGGEGGGPACLDDTGSPPACDSTCEGFTNCSGVDNLKEGVEESLVACMNGLDPVSCGFAIDVHDGCLAETSAITCVDPASDQICADAAMACDGNTEWEATCLAYSDMLNITGQSLFSTCIETECNSGALADDALTLCVYDTFFPIE